MKTRNALMTTAAVLLAIAPTWARAQNELGADIDALDVTMELMPEGATLPEAVTRVIELPEAVPETARQSAAQGLETANQARTNAQAGLAIATEARERGLEHAQENREDAGRGPPDWAGPPGGGPGGPADTPSGPPDDAPGGPPDDRPGGPPADLPGPANPPSGN